MGTAKKSRSSSARNEKMRRRQEFMTIFVGGKQKRIRRPPLIDGMDPDEFIRRNADPVWLHQNEMWEYLDHADEEPVNRDS